MALAFGSLAGCGYQFAGTGNRLPPEIRAISLGPIQNATREVGIEKLLIESLEDEVASHGRLKVVPIGEGDVAADRRGPLLCFAARRLQLQ